jgi:hypothetical protein
MVDRAMMTLIALVNRAMKKKTGRKLREKKNGDEQEKEDARDSV